MAKCVCERESDCVRDPYEVPSLNLKLLTDGSFTGYVDVTFPKLIFDVKESATV